jgi:hypothetical protein
MHMPLPGLVDYPVPNLYKPTYHLVYCGADPIEATSYVASQ